VPNLASVARHVWRRCGRRRRRDRGQRCRARKCPRFLAGRSHHRTVLTGTSARRIERQHALRTAGVPTPQLPHRPRITGGKQTKVGEQELTSFPVSGIEAHQLIRLAVASQRRLQLAELCQSPLLLQRTTPARPVQHRALVPVEVPPAGDARLGGVCLHAQLGAVRRRRRDLAGGEDWVRLQRSWSV
jgi:hypothetical protein